MVSKPSEMHMGHYFGRYELINDGTQVDLAIPPIGIDKLRIISVLRWTESTSRFLFSNHVCPLCVKPLDGSEEIISVSTLGSTSRIVKAQ